MTPGHLGEHSPSEPHSGEAHPLPIDTDLDVDARRGSAGDLLRTVGVIFAGGLAGGLVRYEVVNAWKPPAGGFPWATFAVNTAGAFVLAVLVIVVTDILAESRYLRPLIGTGFCGALTTFSSVAVSVDELAAHGQLATAIGYLAASLGAGGLAAFLGLLLGRRIPAIIRRSAPDQAAQ
jgi:CrcB protein